MNPIGKLLKQDKVLTFGDEIAKLDVVTILPQKPAVQIVSKDNPKVPPYYVALRPTGEPHQLTNVGKPYEAKDRWGHYTLLVLKNQGKTNDFLNVLIPYEKSTLFTATAMGSKGAQLTGTDSTLLIAAGGNDNPLLSVDGGFGVARLDQGKLTSYTLQHGHGLILDKESLLKVELLSKDWAASFDSAVTAAVSLADRRASFSFPLCPMDRGLIMYAPRQEKGKEMTMPISVAVSFKVNAKPKRVIALRSPTAMPQLDAPEFEQKTVAWENDSHKGHYLREALEFTYDQERQTVRVFMDVGIRQLVWE